jgi:putative transposase
MAPFSQELEPPRIPGRFTPIKELCRKHGFSDASFYLWRRKFGGMDVPDAKRLRALEAENAKLKKLLAEAMLDNEALKVVARGKF